MKFRYYFLLLALAFSVAANAKISMPSLFTDNMMLQADTLAAVWGKASPKSDVKISTSWGASASFDSLWMEITDSKDNDNRSYIVCTSDLVYPDEVNDIHARNKYPIGLRLAAAAAATTYGVPGMPYTYPSFKKMDNHGSYAILYFNDAWNGFTPDENLEGFEVAGDDRVFYPAQADIDLSKLSIKVSSDKVPDIKAVRYCFKNFAIGKVHDNFGMPLIPFRTDNWPE